MKLTDREWDVFFIGDLFTVSRPKARSKDDYIEGAIPFVASGSENNGVMKCCTPTENEKLDKSGCITVSPVDGSAFYQSFDFLGRGGAGSSILILRSKKLNLYTGLFIAKMITQTCSCKYTYGHMGNKDNIKRERIMLPITQSGEPDYYFMEEYAKELIEKKKAQYRLYAEDMIKGIDEIRGLGSKKWHSFVISDIFEIKPGKRLVAADSTEGRRPFIGALDNSNGVARFVSDDNASKDKNVLGVNYNGNGMVIGFYHPYECIFSDDVKRFHLKQYPDNEYVLLFMKALILKQKSKFGYLYKFNAERMAHTSILMPVDAEGNPDYAFMEQYGKMLVARKYQQYLDYLDSQKIK